MTEFKVGDKLKLKNGDNITLAKQLADGGEAFIFTIKENKYQHKVARVYKEKGSDGEPVLDSKKIAKLECMSRMDIITPGVTWPTKEGMLYHHNKLVGYVMEYIKGIVLTEFLKKQKEEYKKSIEQNHDKRIARLRWINNLVEVSIAIAAKMPRLHEKGILFADINEKNIMINEADLSAYFIDTDSYQFKDFKTEVGTPGFIAPEILNSQNGMGFLRNSPRTENHEYFALATLFFFLICDSLFPYSIGVPKGIDRDKVNDNDTKVKHLDFVLKIGKSKYNESEVFEKNQTAVVTWGLMPENLQKLFVNAFAKPVINRPNSDNWRNALSEFRVKLNTLIDDLSNKLIKDAVTKKSISQPPMQNSFRSPTISVRPIQNKLPVIPPSKKIKKSAIIVVYSLIAIALVSFLMFLVSQAQPIASNTGFWNKVVHLLKLFGISVLILMALAIVLECFAKGLTKLGIFFIFVFSSVGVIFYSMDGATPTSAPLVSQQQHRKHYAKRHISRAEIAHLTSPEDSINEINTRYHDYKLSQITADDYSNFINQQIADDTKLITYYYQQVLSTCDDNNRHILIQKERDWVTFKESHTSDTNLDNLAQRTIEGVMLAQRAGDLSDLRGSCELIQNTPELDSYSNTYNDLTQFVFGGAK